MISKIIFKQSYLIIDSMKLYGKYKHVAIWKLSLIYFYHNNLVQASKEHTLKGIAWCKKNVWTKYILGSLNDNKLIRSHFYRAILST